MTTPQNRIDIIPVKGKIFMKLFLVIQVNDFGKFVEIFVAKLRERLWKFVVKFVAKINEFIPDKCKPSASAYGA